ncbi:MAG: prolipoprotein diacylglyceryl transferase [Rikenellaceae bacterium]|jgi:prolipoprotein diacylglyceryl transferase|nr:prolipoprotein diacylglyceryl transferase [Rikenellaceae bacterium]
MSHFATVVWNFNPVFFSIGSFEIRWYGVMWALGFAVSMWLFIDFVRREGYPPKVFDSIFWFATLSTIIGARLGHCLFYEPAYFLEHPWQILNLRQGGLASHGAAVGLLLGLWLFSRKNKMPYIWSLDRIMIAVAIAGALVRIGNLLNSEIYGFETARPWGFIFARAGETVPKHPTQIYEALCYLVTFGLLLWLYYKKDVARRRPGLLFGLGIFMIFATRFGIEFIKNPQEAFEQGMALNMGQLLSLPFIVAGAWFVIRALMRPALTPPPLRPWVEPVKKKSDKKHKK